MTDDLVKRLREVSGMNDDGATRWYINPDGPEAADRIEKLEDELHHCFHRIEELQAALREIAAALKVIVKTENMAQALVVVLTSHRKIALAALEKNNDHA